MWRELGLAHNNFCLRYLASCEVVASHVNARITQRRLSYKLRAEFWHLLPDDRVAMCRRMNKVRLKIRIFNRLSHVSHKTHQTSFPFRAQTQSSDLVQQTSNDKWKNDCHKPTVIRTHVNIVCAFAEWQISPFES